MSISWKFQWYLELFVKCFVSRVVILYNLLVLIICVVDQSQLLLFQNLAQNLWNWLGLLLFLCIWWLVDLGSCLTFKRYVNIDVHPMITFWKIHFCQPYKTCTETQTWEKTVVCLRFLTAGNKTCPQCTKVSFNFNHLVLNSYECADVDWNFNITAILPRIEP